MRYLTIALLIILNTRLFPQAQYKSRILLDGNQYFWNFVFDGWDKKYDSEIRGRVYAYDEAANTFEKFLELDGICQKVISNSKGDKIAVVRSLHDRISGYNNYSLILFDSARNKITQFSDVFDFEWFPTQDSLIYITGGYNENNEIGGYTPTGVWILDLRKNHSKKISDTGYWLFIDEESEVVYIDDYRKVYAYNYFENTLRETNLMGNRFSPNGKYYFRNRSGYWPLVVYEAQTNRSIAIQGADSSAQYAQWQNGRDQTLIAGDFYGEKKIIDIGTQSILGNILGKILGFSKNGKEILVYKDKRHLKNLNESKVELIKVE